MNDIIRIIAKVISCIGIVLITWGVLLAAYRFVVLEIRRLHGDNICKSRELLRHHFGSYLLFGLEFLVAADIILTVSEPSFEELIILGGMVTIRTVINYSLNKELVGHDCPFGSTEK